MVTNTRQFFINVKPLILHNTPSTNKSLNSLEVNPNVYFYYSKNFRIPQTRQAQIDFGKTINQQIINIIRTEAIQLQRFWYNNVNSYFNRRASKYNKWMSSWKSGKAPRIELKPKSLYNTSRQHTGQLRRALKIGTVSPYMCELYVSPCIAKTDKTDYVNYLVKGSPPHSGAYSPNLDLRIKSGTWRGIPQTYWAVWQSVFQEQILKAEQKINLKIEKLILQTSILHQADLKSLRTRASGNKQYQSTLETLDDQYNKQFNKDEMKKRNERSKNQWEAAPTWQSIRIKSSRRI